ncbi:MAG: colicin immunity domain-containing protein [Alphaproteobacteria bacterium]
MTIADWRALIEAYLDARISAEAFSRRFMEAERAARTHSEPLPRGITEMRDAVEAFAAESDGREGDVNDDEMRFAARRALNGLGADAPARGFAYATGDSPNFHVFRVNSSGCAGVGCLLGLAWIGLCLLQIYYVGEAIQHAFGWGAFPSALLGVVLAFVPIAGNLLAFAGATLHGWPTWLAAIVFFAAPALTLISGWMRWRRGG